MRWLSSSKVRLGLVVNGLYLLSLLVPSPQSNALTYSLTGARPPARLRSVNPPDYAPLTPQTQPLQADTHYWKHSGQLDVYLTNELTLVRERGHTLLLSPSFSTQALSPERPRTVLFHFSAFSHEQFYDRDSRFVITADGEELWRYGRRAPGDETPPTGKALHSAALDDKGQVFESLGHEIPYDLFVRIVGARRVALELGPERVEFTREQMAALRDMHSRLLQQTRPTNPHGAGQRMDGVYLHPGAPRPNH